jgi:hypothetical protein
MLRKVPHLVDWEVVGDAATEEAGR